MYRKNKRPVTQNFGKYRRRVIDRKVEGSNPVAAHSNKSNDRLAIHFWKNMRYSSALSQIATAFTIPHFYIKYHQLSYLLKKCFILSWTLHYSPSDKVKQTLKKEIKSLLAECVGNFPSKLLPLSSYLNSHFRTFPSQIIPTLDLKYEKYLR